MNRKLLLIGGGGHCRSVIDSVLSAGLYEEIGIVDFADCSCLGIETVGTDDDLPALFAQGWTDAFVTVGSVGDTALRRKLYKKIKDTGFNVPVIADPAAVIAKGTSIGEGSFIGKAAVVNTAASVGECCIINTGAILEHDCVIGDFAHISPRSVLCGEVTVGQDSHVGAGAVVIQQVSIGSRVLVGAGSVVTKDLPDGVKAYGDPCRVIEK